MNKIRSLPTRKSPFQIHMPLPEFLACSSKQVHKNFGVRGRQQQEQVCHLQKLSQVAFTTSPRLKTARMKRYVSGL